MGRRWIFPLALLLVLALLSFEGVLPRLLGNPAEPDPPGTAPGPETGPYIGGPEADERIISERDLARLFPGLVFRYGSPDKPQVAITFDDGPDDRFTPKVLDILEAYDAPATFYLVGTMVERFPAVARRIVADGHEVGQHGYQHVDFSNLSDSEIRWQLSQTEEAFQRLLGINPKTFRPPYAALNPRGAEVIGEEGYKIILWSIDSLDWRGISKEDILNNVLPELHPGAIILMHSAGGDLTGMTEALPLLLEALEDRGLEPVSVSELLDLPSPENGKTARPTS